MSDTLLIGTPQKAGFYPERLEGIERRAAGPGARCGWISVAYLDPVSRNPHFEFDKFQNMVTAAVQPRDNQ